MKSFLQGEFSVDKLRVFFDWVVGISFITGVVVVILLGLFVGSLAVFAPFLKDRLEGISLYRFITNIVFWFAILISLGGIALGQIASTDSERATTGLDGIGKVIRLLGILIFLALIIGRII